MIVKNCPCIEHYDDVELDNRCMGTQDGIPFFCENNPDCVIKQVIEKCKDMASDKDYYAYDFANEILQLFDIEEINK